MTRFCAAVAVCVALISTCSWTQEKEKKVEPELLVAAAADLNPALHDIAQQFEKKTGVRDEAFLRSIRSTHSAD